ncbi:SDR family oxidoreductase [Frigidibacter sp. MR17.24]|uniref:SDR family oxidoreductase n=1 Tax=Frigidibacter sp. MR17.24 TaxID=3127345 RepID=UPI003012A809
MDLQLTGRRALVLASSRGLGLGVATALVAEGAHVLLTGRDADRLAAAAADLTARGPGRADWTACDLGAEGAVETLVAAVADKLGGIDILVNNSGGPAPGPVHASQPESWRKGFESMIAPIVALTHALVPQMRAQGWGRVLTLASSGVAQPIPNLGISNSLRAALQGWSKTLATEVAADGVTANLLLPGRIHTDRVDELDAAAAARTGKTPAEVATASRATIPAGRYGRVEEFAAVAAFLCSGPASYVTGTSVRCDGGMIRGV